VSSAKGADRDPLAWMFRSTAHLLDGRFDRARAAAERAARLAASQPELLPYIERRIRRCQQRRSVSAELVF
jgi:hypothetical protein